MFREIDETISVAPQISVADVASAKAQGFTLIINNRPDHEDAEQPLGDAIAAAARAHGLNYIAIPVTHAGFSHPQLEAMGAALDGCEGKALAFCRSGTRSTFLWSLARARAGDPPRLLAAKAAAAGYDLTPVRPMLEALAAGQ